MYEATISLSTAVDYASCSLPWTVLELIHPSFKHVQLTCVALDLDDFSFHAVYVSIMRVMAVSGLCEIDELRAFRLE